MTRAAGIPNKNKRGLKARLRADFDLDVIEEMARIVTSKDEGGEYIMEPVTRFDKLYKLAEYVEAKRKALEVTGEDGGPLEISVQKYVGMLDAD